MTHKNYVSIIMAFLSIAGGFMNQHVITFFCLFLDTCQTHFNLSQSGLTHY